MQLTGIHHLTAVTARAADNFAFYTRVLGQRLVKKTVNQDDVSAYHLFYADGLASPGSDLTFFDWPAPRERRGTNSVARTMLRVSGDGTLAWWREHLARQGVTHRLPVERDGRLTLDFEDPEGQRLSLVDDGGAGPAHPWEPSPVPAARQIRGLGPILISVADPAATEAVLTGVMGMRAVRTYAAADAAAEGSAQQPVQVYAMGEGGPAAELHVVAEPALGPARQGAGGVHHVAFRIPDADYEAWAERLRSLRVPSSGPVDRYYFRSLYFREPNGVLFEIATDGPGFATNEPLARLGERLALPPFLEPRRAEIEAGLAPL
ncbi:Putative ring-cleaving dioxygenase MhqA [Methylobacterium crusticola]|uniref:Ring-cleaving dioxygenase MhqA n=1 Tax=Methylobacterium crusticola TaxID=1697972 RepID=A0ABQ4QWB2_9HYPH|nr:ring-cleaving dioxygenase [Methylobacterium crusticola]GJD49160.1 Putative ring-cleaving dioxygenase MhqA [Methylobacterium crusticola]